MNTRTCTHTEQERNREYPPEDSEEECKNGQGHVAVQMEESGHDFLERHAAQDSPLFSDGRRRQTRQSKHKPVFHTANASLHGLHYTTVNSTRSYHKN